MDLRNRKVFVIGLDGATFDIIDPLIKRGKLPHLASLMNHGAISPLKSTLMPNSFPAWVSCVTGVNPGKHGIFWSLIRTNNLAYPLKLMNSTDIKAHTLWERLGNQGFKVGVVNVPTDYPPFKVNGFLVCGALTPNEDAQFTYPAELREEILRVVPGYKCEIDYAQTSLTKLASQIFQSIENRERLILRLLEDKPWDLFFVVFTETDLTQHKYWAGIDNRHPDYSYFNKTFGTFVHTVYERLDETLGKVIEKISDETIIFVVSDHGFGPFYQSFSLNQWLIENEYLVLNESWISKSTTRFLKKLPWSSRAKWVRSYLSYLVLARKGKANVRSLREKDILSSGKFFTKIDWNKTKAYFTPDYGIRINLKGREPHGIIAPGEKETSLIQEMKEKLNHVRYSNGQPVFEAVQTKEEAFPGPFMKDASDLIVPINHAQAPPFPENWKFTLTHPTLKGTHSPYGIFIAKGPGIKKGCRIERAEILDITPTILYLFGEPITQDMDGKVLLDIFEPTFNKNKIILTQDSSTRFKSEKSVYSEEEEEGLVKKLRDLGYMD